MIRKLITRVFARKTAATATEPQLIDEATHGIDPRDWSSAAVRVTDVLQEAGYQAFIVGGAVRDLLLGRRPKDFDVATSATPEQVHALFRRSRIIGRRFQLVHVPFGQEIIEVSTFRGASDAGQEADDSGRILRDNVFGTLEEDACRRDFTANALYYDPATGYIHDYLDGVADIDEGILRVIGDPEQRYREDPVRMLRAVRLSAKLGLRLDDRSARPVAGLAGLLQHVPSARLLDEMLKLLMSGHAEKGVEGLEQHGLSGFVLPMLARSNASEAGRRFVRLALASTDARIQQDKPVSPAFLFAAMFWQHVLDAWETRQAQGERPLPALFEAMEEVTERDAVAMSIPRRHTTVMKEIWGLQPRLLQRSGARPYKLLANPRFRAAFDFMLLRCEAGEMDAEIGQWWEDFQHADDAARRAMLESQPEEGAKRRRRRPRRKGGGDREAPAAAE